jgi:hypothetical protein
MEPEEVERKVHAFQARLNRFLSELGILAPLQRRLVEDAAKVAALLKELGDRQCSNQNARHEPV